MPPRRLHHALAPLLAAALVGDAAGSVALARQPDPPVTITSDNARAVERLTDTTTRALKTLQEWLGPLPATPLTVIDLPWGTGSPGESRAGTVATRMRWITPVRDVAAERTLIAAVARQFWLTGSESTDPWFREALVVYSATRAIHAVLEGRNYDAPRFFGGFVPIPLRSLVLSPNMAGAGARLSEFEEVLTPASAPWRFAPVDSGSPARRAAAALQTLERVIGWPAMQQALSETRLRAGGGAISPELLAAVVAEQRGVSMDWFVRDLVRSSDVIDYAVGGVSSEPGGEAIRTTVQVEKRGRGVFSGTDQPSSAGTARSLTVLVRFADGTEARTFVDGREERAPVVFEGPSRATAVAIDPDEIVLVDANRLNNVWTDEPPANRIGFRLVANWMIWLQNVMLTYSAIA